MLEALSWQARLGQRQLGLRQTVLCINLAACPQRLLDQKSRLGSPAGGRGFCAHRRIPRPLGCLQIGLGRLHLGLFGFHAGVMGGREAQGIGQSELRGRRHRRPAPQQGRKHHTGLPNFAIGHLSPKHFLVFYLFSTQILLQVSTL